MNIDTVMMEYGLSALPEDPVEAMAYVPFQPYDPPTYKPVLGYEYGTIYKTLNKPFYGGKCGVNDGE